MIAMLDDFFIRAVLAGIGVAIIAAPLGCFVVWRRMAYFGDATAHASILGVALALSFSTSVFLGALIIALMMAISISVLSGRGYAMDTLLGVVSHSALAVGLVVASLLTGLRIDLMAYLFGDILAVGKDDLFVIICGVAIIAAFIYWRWSALLVSTLNSDLAAAAGVNAKREQLLLNISLAVIVAMAIKIVGILLIAAMLIIPAATVRLFSRTPEQMAIFAAGAGIVSVIGGMNASYQLDLPAGPAIICVAASLFIISNLLRLITDMQSAR